MEDIKILIKDYLFNTKEQNKTQYNKVIQELNKLNILIRDFGYGSYETFHYIYGKYNRNWWEDFFKDLHDSTNNGIGGDLEEIEEVDIYQR